MSPPYHPEKPAYRRTVEKLLYHFYLRFGTRSRFFSRKWMQHEAYRVMKILARQQVYGFIANPEGGSPIWYVDAPENVQENRLPLCTCLLRGWIEIYDTRNQAYSGVPVALPLVPSGGSLEGFSNPPYYRVTTAGWNALHRHYLVAKIALALGILGFGLSLTNSLILKPSPPPLKVIFPAPLPPNQKAQSH
jgi:hypothetical protein